MIDNKTFINNKREINIQKPDYCRLYRSNSQFHYKSISNSDFENRLTNVSLILKTDVKINPKNERKKIKSQKISEDCDKSVSEKDESFNS